VPVLEKVAGKKDPWLIGLAVKALRGIGSAKAAGVLARIAEGSVPSIVSPGQAIEILSQMEPAVAVPALAGLLPEGKSTDPAPIAWIVAHMALPAHAPIIQPLAESENPDVHLAGLAGLLRLGQGDAVEAITAFALGDATSADPLPFLDFLTRHPHLCKGFSTAICTLSRSRRIPVRISAARCLGHLGKEASVKAILEAMIDSEAPVRKAAVEAACRRLRLRSDFRLLKGLGARAKDGEYAVRKAALLGLGRAGDRGAGDLILAKLPGEDPDEVETALDALSLFRAPDLLAKVPLELYWGTNLNARRRLVKALVMASDASASKVLRALLRLPDAESKRLALSLLDPRDAKGFTKELRDMASMTDAELKALSIRFLAIAHDKAPGSDPLPYLSSPDAGIRSAAVQALGMQEKTEERLLELAESVDPVLRREALKALAAHPVAVSKQRFEAVVFEGDADLRRIAVEALGRIGDPESLPFLVVASTDPHRNVRAAAAMALGAFPGEEVKAHLERLGEDADPLVQVAAAVGLKRRGEGKAASDLAEALKSGTLAADPMTRGRWLSMLGDPEGAAEAFQAGISCPVDPWEAFLETARAWARAGDGEKALKPLSRAMAMGFDAYAGLEEDPAFQPLFAKGDFAERIKRLFRPSRKGEGFLGRFQGRVRMHLRNGSDLRAVLLGFRDERFILALPTGESEIPRRQVDRVEFVDG
jgi:HEAT repeat protein